MFLLYFLFLSFFIIIITVAVVLGINQTSPKVAMSCRFLLVCNSLKEMGKITVNKVLDRFFSVLKYCVFVELYWTNSSCIFLYFIVLLFLYRCNVISKEHGANFLKINEWMFARMYMLMFVLRKKICIQIHVSTENNSRCIYYVFYKLQTSVTTPQLHTTVTILWQYICVTIQYVCRTGFNCVCVCKLT